MRKYLCALLLCMLPWLPQGVAFADDGGQKAILVTGASTGIGRNIAETLAANGHFVYAGARKQADLDALSAIENIQGIRLDVTIALGDIGVGLMAWFNIVAILILFFMGNAALKALKDYEAQRKAGVEKYTFDPEALGIKNADFWSAPKS